MSSVGLWCVSSVSVDELSDMDCTRGGFVLFLLQDVTYALHASEILVYLRCLG